MAETVDENPTEVLPSIPLPPPQTKSELLRRLGLSVPEAAPTTQIPRIRRRPAVSMPSNERLRSWMTVLALSLVALLAVFGIVALSSSGGSQGSDKQPNISVQDTSSSDSGPAPSSDKATPETPTAELPSGGGHKPSSPAPEAPSEPSQPSPGSAPPADLGGGVNP